MNEEEEKETILERFFYADRFLFRFGTLAQIPWFERYKVRFEGNKYAYFPSDEERTEAKKIIISLPREKFIEIANKLFLELKEKDEFHPDFRFFFGEIFFFSPEEGFKIENRRDEVRKAVKKALEETKGRAYYFLKAIINLWKRKEWDKVYDGATFVNITSEIRNLKGSLPSPRDLVILKSYNLYYKHGSRRYPVHSIPKEIIDLVEEEIEKWKA
ncbi:MAG: hypothetical protein ACP5H3_03810 [Candidatus Aenigmatarchaeota archaeon]|jgi:hypothetical protein